VTVSSAPEQTGGYLQWQYSGDPGCVNYFGCSNTGWSSLGSIVTNSNTSQTTNWFVGDSGGANTHATRTVTLSDLIDVCASALARLPGYDGDFNDGCQAGRHKTESEDSCTISRFIPKFTIAAARTTNLNIRYTERLVPDAGGESAGVDTVKYVTIPAGMTEVVGDEVLEPDYNAQIHIHSVGCVPVVTLVCDSVEFGSTFACCGNYGAWPTVHVSHSHDCQGRYWNGTIWQSGTIGDTSVCGSCFHSPYACAAGVAPCPNDCGCQVPGSSSLYSPLGTVYGCVPSFNQICISTEQMTSIGLIGTDPFGCEPGTSHNSYSDGTATVEDAIAVAYDYIAPYAGFDDEPHDSNIGQTRDCQAVRDVRSFVDPTNASVFFQRFSYKFTFEATTFNFTIGWTVYRPSGPTSYTEVVLAGATESLVYEELEPSVNGTTFLGSIYTA
jgi:hypothetical protein